jgi:histidinol-phosphate aminotransferase
MPKNVPAYIQSLVPYAPGKPIEETQREFGLKKVVKLASNENPLGPSPRAARAASRALRELQRYPDGAAFRLKQALSKQLSVDAREIVVGAGSNENIDFLIRAYCREGDAILQPRYSFVAYRICAQIHGVETVETPVSEVDFSVDVQLLIAAAANPRVKIVFLANPNNPTGTWLVEEEVTRLIEGIREKRGDSVLIVLDYAYWEYITDERIPDPVKLLRKYPQNVVVLKTFSKIYGLGGVRLGYSLAAPEMSAVLEKIRQPFNGNSLALAAGEAALSDRAFVKKAIAVNEAALALWMGEMADWGVPLIPSQGNFLLLNTRKGWGMSGPELFQACLRRGLILRPVANYGLPDWIRVSMGTLAENRFALKVLKELRARSVASTPAKKTGRGRK